ncbi:hypothetical protein DH09_00870 (plasmid) [Bacillaceae bacterium JMAK1]|nr:hypothetical protein DH09_00870 [Bacillaceae bacterium JMAK1]
MSINLILLLISGVVITVGWTLMIAKNPGDENYSASSSFNMLTLMYTIVVPIVVLVVVAILYFFY